MCRKYRPDCCWRWQRKYCSLCDHPPTFQDENAWRWTGKGHQERASSRLCPFFFWFGIAVRLSEFSHYFLRQSLILVAFWRRQVHPVLMTKLRDTSFVPFFGQSLLWVFMLGHINHRSPGSTSCWSRTHVSQHSETALNSSTRQCDW